jgi:hypothetical protein
MRFFFRNIRITLAISMLAGFAYSSFGQAGLTLGGHFIPKDSFMLFIDMGNSAMSGRDDSPDLVTNPHLWKFEMSPANYDWLPAKEPICVDAYNKIATPLGGPIMPFLKRLLVNYPNYYFGVMQLSNSGWTLQGHFNPGAADVSALITRANLLKANVTIAGIVSMLNTVEVQNRDTANYTQHVADMVSNVRTSLGSLQYQGATYTVPYIHAGYPVMSKDGAAQYDTSHVQTKSIMRQIAEIPGKVQNCVIIPGNGLTICMNCTPSGYYDHYDPAGNLGWGNRAADSVKSRGWIPPSTTSISANQQYRIFLNHAPAMQKVLFDGANWSAFDKTGKSFSIYSPNGRAITGMTASLLRTKNLRPGVYILHSNIAN